MEELLTIFTLWTVITIHTSALVSIYFISTSSTICTRVAATFIMSRNNNTKLLKDNITNNYLKNRVKIMNSVFIPLCEFTLLSSAL